MLELFFLIDIEFYEQCDGVAMVYILGFTLANVFKCGFAKISLENCLPYFEPYFFLISNQGTIR